VVEDVVDDRLSDDEIGALTIEWRRAPRVLPPVVLKPASEAPRLRTP
jgi:hypothetical protein